VTNGGYEYNLTLIGVSVALAETGPGSPSVDAGLFPKFKGTGLALLGLAAGAAGSYLATSDRLAQRAPAKSEGQVEQFPSDAAVREPARKFTREGVETRPGQQA
jgi:hypothetical protein